MGKGRGSVCGKPARSQEPGVEPTPPTVPEPTTQDTAKAVVPDPEPAKVESAPAVEDKPATTQSTSANMAETKKIFIIFYSTYGHIYTMAKAVKEGVDSVEGLEGVLYQVPETLPADVLEKMHAPPKPDVPVIDRDDLPKAAGFIFGIPTRFGAPAAQIKAFFDSTGAHWQSGALAGKPASIFVSTATQGGGQETTAFTTITNFVHHGIIYVPPGYTYGAGMFDTEKPKGGSPWGAGTIAGPTGALQPTENELGYAKHQGAYFGKIALKLAA